jgi:antitoxin component YwqK of YwqJK toxin-antitoxin module
MKLEIFDLDLSICVNEVDSLRRKQGFWKEEYMNYTFIADDTFSVGLYVDDYRHGLWYHFDAGGNILWAGNFKHGILDGKWLYKFEENTRILFRNEEVLEGESIDFE